MWDRLRYIRWKMIGYAFLVVLGLAGVGMLMSLITKKDKTQVCTSLRVMIEGKESFIDQQDISNIINEGFGKVIGRSVVDIPLQEIESVLSGLPYVSNAEVYLDMDGMMQVKVYQREVVLRVVSQMGEEYYVDSEGAKIPVTLKYVPHVMVANGFIGEGYTQPLEKIESSVVTDLVRIVDHIQRDPLWLNQVVQLFVNRDQDIEIVPRVGDQQLILGTADSLDYKLGRLEVFYSKILPKVGSDAYETVNVKYDGQIICERRGDWFIDSLQMEMNTIN